MKKIDRRIIIVAAAIFILALSFGLMKFLIAQKAEPPSRRSIDSKRYVEAKVVDYSTIHSSVSEPGRMSSVAEIDLSAEASGKILQGDISLKSGASFQKGDLLFSIYSDEVALALKAKKSQFLNTLALLLPDISIDFPEYEQVFGGFFTSIDIGKKLPSFPDVKDEKLKIFLASKNVLSDFYGIRKDELQLSRHAVKATFDGTLTDVFLEVGAYTNAGGRVAHAIRTDILELEVPLKRIDAAWVNIGDPVNAISEKRSLKWAGVVIRKSQYVDENTQSQRVFVSLKNQQKTPLLSGEYLMASFPGHPVDNVMEIPRNAVSNTNEVFVISNSRLRTKYINIIKINTNTLLFNGLPLGDTVVVQPLINVYEGTVVTSNLSKESSAPGGQSKQKPSSTDKKGGKDKKPEGEKSDNKEKQ